MESSVIVVFTPNFFINSAVISTYGLETNSPDKRIFNGSCIAGAIIINADINCELMLASISTLPPRSLRPVIFNGGKPSFAVYSISAPIVRSAVTRGLIGRCLILSLPSRITVRPSRVAKYAVRKRIAVPAAPMLILSLLLFSAAAIALVSSHSAYVGSIAPSVRAFISISLLLMLLESGSVMRGVLNFLPDVNLYTVIDCLRRFLVFQVTS